ncbi:hypothetical protein QUA30_04820 [Microcoleus sp. Pol14C2]|uniref:hypothetical protein n=1 Tax=unclassified Microcoleus TaxID=2642155 RepID=UPI002FD72FF6
MIAFIVPRREAGAAGGLPHLRFRLLGLAGLRSLRWWMPDPARSRSVNLGKQCMFIF